MSPQAIAQYEYELAQLASRLAPQVPQVRAHSAAGLGNGTARGIGVNSEYHDAPDFLRVSDEVTQYFTSGPLQQGLRECNLQLLPDRCRDGNCYFYSVLESLQALDPDLLFTARHGIILSVEDLRRDVADFIENNRGRFSRLYPSELDFKRAVQSIRTRHEWADSDIIHIAVAEIFNVDIRIVSTQDAQTTGIVADGEPSLEEVPRVFYSAEVIGSRACISLAWRRESHYIGTRAAGSTSAPDLRGIAPFFGQCRFAAVLSRRPSYFASCRSSPK